MPPLPHITPNPDLDTPPAVVASARSTEDGSPPDDLDTPPMPMSPPIPSTPSAQASASMMAAPIPTPARGNAMAWMAGLSGVPPWVLVFLALTPWGQKMMGMEHEDPAQGRAAIVSEVRREMGAEIKAGLDGLRAELARDREAHEREHALEEKGTERELAALREEMRLLREALTNKRR